MKIHEEEWNAFDYGGVYLAAKVQEEGLDGDLVFARFDSMERAILAAQSPAMARLLLRLVSADEFAKDRPIGTLERDAFDILREAKVIP